MKNNEVFEAHIWQQPPEAYQGKIPFVVSDMIDQMKHMHCEKVEGIFRLNGSDILTKRLIEALDAGRIKDWSKYQNVHTVATALKRYFRSMATTEPIIPFRLYNEIIRIGKEEPSKESHRQLKEFFKKLDTGRYNTLSYLIKFLNFIASHAEENKMTSSNLAVCFGPNIIVSDRPDSPEALKDSFVIVNVLDDIIANYYILFDNAEQVEQWLCDEEDIAILTLPPLEWSHIKNLITRCKERTKNKAIKYIPFVNFQQGLAINRPTRKPPPVISENNDEMAQFRSGYSDFYGDAVGLQNPELLLQSIGPQSHQIFSMNHELKESKFALELEIEEDPPLGNTPQQPVISFRAPALTQEEVFVPPDEEIMRRAKRSGKRRPPTRH